MKWKSLQMPKRIEFDEKTMTDRFGRFHAQPFERRPHRRHALRAHRRLPRPE